VYIVAPAARATTAGAFAANPLVFVFCIVAGLPVPETALLLNVPVCLDAPAGFAPDTLSALLFVDPMLVIDFRLPSH
jgi:hypothetical protein